MVYRSSRSTGFKEYDEKLPREYISRIILIKPVPTEWEIETRNILYSQSGVEWSEVKRAYNQLQSLK